VERNCRGAGCACFTPLFNQPQRRPAHLSNQSPLPRRDDNSSASTDEPPPSLPLPFPPLSNQGAGAQAGITTSE
jgi:hypothetical protein